MTKRETISTIQNIWSDAQQVDNDDLTVEQEYNDTVTSSLVSNHIGTGVLPENLISNNLFDSMLVSGYLDGTIVNAQNQPSDNNLGNQLEVTLSESKVAGNKTVKLAIIGLDFESNLQYELFYFKVNETQVSKKHFTNILLILINDFIGDPSLSLNLGGRLVINEARSMTLSRDSIMLAQDKQPNLFFRDFFVYGYTSLSQLLKTALPYYDTGALDIYIVPSTNKTLAKNDVTTQFGQKFLAKTNNIQKITLLLSVNNTDSGQETNLVWNGDLILSIYPLQSTLDCPSDYVPNSAIEFPPSNIPLAQISINYTSLQASGIVLDSVPQPVDFIFSNSTVSLGNVITVGSYYAFTLKRVGSADKCNILIAAGEDYVSDSRLTSFGGSVWVDSPDEDLWFKIYTDAAKVSDGQAYETGHGVSILKTVQDSDSGATVDYCLDKLSFVGNDVYRAVLFSATEESNYVPDQRTGQPVASRKQYIPQVTLFNTIDYTNLSETTEPFAIGAISDKNVKYYDSISSIINSKLHSSSIVNDEILIKIIDDSTDVGRYDTSVTSLVTNLLNGDLVNAKIIPNTTKPSNVYRIAEAKLCSMILGDVNNDGIVDEKDLELLNSYVGYDLNLGLNNDTLITTDGYTTTYSNGYTTYTKPFSNQVSILFQLVDPTTNTVVASGFDGIIAPNPNNPRLGQFTSLDVNFSSIIGLSSFKLVILNSSKPENHGGFTIKSLDTNNDVITIEKIYLTGDVMSEIFRCDIDGDFYISGSDGYLLQSYINRDEQSSSPSLTYPAPSTNPYSKIGKPFSLLRLKLQKVIDRNDDYSSNPSTRASNIHVSPDIYLTDGYLGGYNFYTNPLNLSIQKQLSWDESLIVTNARSRNVACTFVSTTGFSPNACTLEGIKCNIYPSKPDFDSGKVDFYFPDNIIIGEGDLVRPDGNFYKVDFEVGTIVLEIPDGLFESEKSINILNDFIASYEGTNLTRLGFPAMKFADCTFVEQDALQKDQLRFSVAVQSFSPNTNGLSSDGYYGAIVDGKIGVNIDYQTGLLTLNFTNLYQDNVLSTLNTKIQINVFLKKGGFNNTPLFVDSAKVQNMLNLISVFSGSNLGGPSALVDLENDVSGALPIIHGGTGLNATGVYGTVLASSGTSLSYQFISDLAGVVPFSLGIPNANQIPKTDGYGFLDPSFMYKNPVYIYAASGIFTNTTTTPTAVGALSFRFDKYILEGLSSINLEVILETNNILNSAYVRLYDVTNSSYLTLSGGNNYMFTSYNYPSLLISDDLKSQLLSGANDNIYEVRIYLASGGGLATCKMARLVMTYNNPSNVGPPLAHSYNFVPYLPSPTPS